MILTHGANSLKSEITSVEIGGRSYPVVKIGSQLWMAENLDYKFDVNGSQIPIGPSGTPTTSAAWYYYNDEASYGIDGTYKCGLLYNWYAAKYLDDNKSTLLPDGWHVPTSNEFNILVTFIGGASVVGGKLKALDGSIVSNWPNDWNGTDDFGFGALPAGGYWGDFGSLNTYAGLVTSESYDSSLCNTIGIHQNDSIVGFGPDHKRYGYSIRLVKDAP